MANDDITVRQLTEIFKKLLRLGTTNIGKRPVPLVEEEIWFIIDRTLETLKKQTNALIEITAPITVCGDTHGQFNDLVRLLDYCGWPPDTRYLFLGDYVDRGKQSIETICLMFAFKVRFPEDFHLLRGNHESPMVNRIYGFYDECKRRYSVRLWRYFQKAFSQLPVACYVSNRIFCVHGGLSPALENIDQLRQLKLPLEIPKSGLLSDLVWSDPDPTVTGFQPNPRGVSVVFGPNIVKEFCSKFEIDLIIRAHQVFESGYEFFADKKLVTIFSAPNYGGEFQNCAAAIVIATNLSCKIKQFKPKY